MKLYRDAQKRRETKPCAELAVSEEELLAQWGFSAEQIVSLLWLRQWFQAGSSDCAVIVRCLAFLRLLTRCGELEI